MLLQIVVPYRHEFRVGDSANEVEVGHEFVFQEELGILQAISRIRCCESTLGPRVQKIMKELAGFLGEGHV